MQKVLRALALLIVVATTGATMVLAATNPYYSGPGSSSFGAGDPSLSGYTQNTASGDSNNANSSRRSSEKFLQTKSDSPGLKSATSSSVIQQIVQTVARQSIVVPDASAPRALQGAAQTAQNAQDAIQSAQLIEAIRAQAASSSSATGSRAPTTTAAVIPTIIIQNLVQQVIGSGGSRAESLAPQQQMLPKTQSGSSTVATTSASSSGRSSAPAGSRSTTAIRQLEVISSSVNTISSRKNTVSTQVNDIVSQIVSHAVNQAILQVTQQSPATSTPFSEAQRTQKLEDIKKQANIQGQQIATQVAQSVAAGQISPTQVDPVLRSSMQDIATLVSADAGVPVSVPTLENRDVSQQLQNAAQAIQQSQDAIAQRDGLDLYVDSDHDGISDYDEVHIYHTDPHNAYTAGGSLTDGERVLLGLDPHTTTPAAVPVEDPRNSGATTDALFAVTNIATVTAPASASPASTAVAPAPQASSTPAAQPDTAIRFSGRALPNSFVTLYVFSTPIVVTVKTDDNGLWTYTLDQRLEDGQHEMYVATVDDSGRILAKSPAVPFTKTAEALSYEPLTIQDVTAPSPLDVLRENFVVTAAVLLGIFLMIGLLTVGFWRERAPAI